MVKKERDEVLVGKTRRTRTGCGNLYVTVNFENDIPIEVFIRLGKAGGCASSQTEALGRLISLSLKEGASLKDIIKQLQGIGCHLPTFVGMGNRNLSCADAVAHCLRLIGNIEPDIKTKIEREEKAIKRALSEKEKGTPCPDCGVTLIFEEGCAKCTSCGYTKC